MEPSFEHFVIPDEELKSIDLKTCININIGVMGHIDSGKTSLSRALTRITSTAALDKNPQSKERGITLDLGFSAFFTKFPSQRFPDSKIKYLQFTLVDCPGHASLIKTIIGGASIIDVMFLVIDVTKGIQTQTSECIVIGEILMPKVIVILNKIDLLPEENREDVVNKKVEALKKILSKTKFGNNLPVIPIAAAIGAETEGKNNKGIEQLVHTLLDSITIPKRNANGPFFYLIDHCFAIKGQGTVATGTVIQGSISAGQDVEFPELKMTKKIKSMQMFKKPIDKVIQGDRVGMLFTQLDSKLIERSIASEPNYIKTTNYVIILAQKVNYFKGSINSKAKFHITTGHQTVMGKLTFFNLPGAALDKIEASESSFQQTEENAPKFSFETEYQFIPEYSKDIKGRLFMMVELETPLLVHEGQTLIGSKLDTDIEANTCRIAFYGKILKGFDTEASKTIFKDLKILKWKEKKGVVDRVMDQNTILVSQLFTKASNIDTFIGSKIQIPVIPTSGTIRGTFGQSGKIKVQSDTALFTEENKDEIQKKLLGSEVILKIKKYLFKNK